MVITATELKTNLGKYLTLVDDEDIIITKNGRDIAVLSRPKTDKESILNSLLGVINLDEKITLDAVKDERLKRQ